MPQDETTRLMEQLLELRHERKRVLPAGLFTSDQPVDMLIVLFLADAHGERLTGRETVARAGGSLETAKRWMKYLTSENMIVGDGDGNLDDVIALTPRALCGMEDHAKSISARLASVYADDRKRA